MEMYKQNGTRRVLFGSYIIQTANLTIQKSIIPRMMTSKFAINPWQENTTWWQPRI